ncbi:sporulation initiation factor Spo0A C-terminal domain-containing protein [Anaerotignum lactatifermentans]|uniref:Stage 0 sporulation protein A homolog n=2 Tax=Anaerotignum lactatifermentans TaxID=160404 RepID=A0ABS2G791_9FIRM|nr:sporulation initiation factor Spo0A C-terminal domain-containing protein [Anaerotignum lactatifermentans]MBM6828219.1 response regulator [Anaerotignum lactatifermentans]MBM6876618.1 response regulator [Anaerotignum lactatifermentans]
MEQRKLSVVIGDRDLFYSQRLKYSLERRGSLSVVGMTDNGPELLEIINRYRPDVVLMDVLLGERDGFWVLERMKGSGSLCIMVSAIDNDVLVRRAITLGAAYYMAKPIQGDLLLERMEQLLDLRLERQELLKSRKPAEAPVPTVKRDPWEGLEAEVSICLSRMGISAGLKGYHFVRRAVIMAVEDPEVLTGITKGLYPDIAKMYKTTASKVERAIRHAITAAWKGNGQQVYFEISGCLMVEKPTNGQFIAMMAEYFRMKNRTAISKIG